MNFFRALFWVLCFFALTSENQSLKAQDRATLSGTIADAETGEKLIGVSIFFPEQRKGTTTNEYGFYSINMPPGNYEVVVSYIGYQRTTDTLSLEKSIKKNYQLTPNYQLKEVEVAAAKNTPIHESSRMSTIDLPIAQIQAMPAFMGEVDVLKSMQLLPGIQSGSEASNGLIVRGGSPDQNLILMDGVPVYNISHLFGFFSVFQAPAIHNVKIITGGFPARYGGRLSSVIDLQLKEGNMQSFKGEGSIGLISSRLMLEGPIVKGKTSFMLAARRTYLDLFTVPISRMASGGDFTTGFYFYDLNAKINHRFSDRDHLYLSFYGGRDQFYARSNQSFVEDRKKYDYLSESGLGWGNVTGALRWNHILNDKTFINNTLSYTKFEFGLGSSFEEKINGQRALFDDLRYTSGIRDYGLKTDIDYFVHPNHHLRFGAAFIQHQFSPGFFNYSSSFDRIDTIFGQQNIAASEVNLYAEDDFDINENFKLNYGFHAAAFWVQSSEYFSFQPRISGRYLLGRNYAVKASYAQMQQFIHLLTNQSLGLPSDLWMPSTDRIKPQASQQVAIGLAKSFDKEGFTASLEGFYKKMENVIEYLPGAGLFQQDQWEDMVAVGDGMAYGVEFFLHKQKGKTNGWVSYTWSKATRLFDELNQGRAFPFKYDRRHDFSIFVQHTITKHISFAATWVYGTGNAITLPQSSYASLYQNYSGMWGNGHSTVEDFGDRNSFRMASYHRLDLGLHLNKEINEKLTRTWVFSVYNAYNRQNPFFIYNGINSSGNRSLRQVSLFPILPSISYQLQF